MKHTQRLTFTLYSGTKLTVDLTVDPEHRYILDMALRAYGSKHHKVVDAGGVLTVTFVGAVNKDGEWVS